MALLQDPITQRDFSAGRIAKTAVATALMPNYSSHTLTSAVNSVANGINVDFSEVIGSGIVRKGKQNIIQITGTMTDGQAERVSNPGDELRIHDATIQAQTFTPTSGQTTTFAIALKLYFVGSIIGLMSPAEVTISLTATSGGKPIPSIINGNTWNFNAGTLTTSTSGQVYLFPCSPGTVLTAGTTYAIVVQFSNGDSGDYVEWIRNASTTYAGGISQTSTNSGSTWSNNTGAFYFAQEVAVSPNTYNLAPLGNWSFLNANLPKNVLGFEINSSGLNEGAIFYYNALTSSWQISNLFTLSSSAKIRFANMDTYVYEANGINLMKSSADFGATWTVTNCIFPFAVDDAAAWDSGISYAMGDLVSYGGFFWSSLIDSNSNNQPDTSPNDWEKLFPIYPSLLIVAGNRLLAGGITAYPSRIYFSALVDPTTPAGLTWNIDPVTGDFIDVDPDSGGQITGFANTASLTLVFKNNAMYRLNAITKTTDAENIYNVGAVSQEAIANCQGLTYFYSGTGIYQTDGTFPQQISRIAVQDYVDAITDPLQVYSWNDEFNAYFSLGAITVQFGPEDIRSYQNVVLKFSPRDQNWQIFTYNQYLAQTSQFGVPPAKTLSTEYNGYIAYVNTNTISDDGAAIPFDLETQELEFGNRAHTKNISNSIVVYARNGNESAFSVKSNDGDFVSANMTLENRVNVGTDVNFAGEFFTFRWRGEALGSRPIFEGFTLPTITDLGVTQNTTKG